MKYLIISIILCFSMNTYANVETVNDLQSSYSAIFKNVNTTMSMNMGTYYLDGVVYWKDIPSGYYVFCIKGVSHQITEFKDEQALFDHLIATKKVSPVLQMLGKVGNKWLVLSDGIIESKSNSPFYACLSEKERDTQIISRIDAS